MRVDVDFQPRGKQKRVLVVLSCSHGLFQNQRHFAVPLSPVNKCLEAYFVKSEPQG